MIPNAPASPAVAGAIVDIYRKHGQEIPPGLREELRPWVEKERHQQPGARNDSQMRRVKMIHPESRLRPRQRPCRSSRRRKRQRRKSAGKARSDVQP
jgi:hypothetical protein